MEVHTRQMPISDDFDIEWVMENTYGFVGADLAALVRESAMKALRRYLPEINLDEDTIPPETSSLFGQMKSISSMKTMAGAELAASSKISLSCFSLSP